MSIDSNDDTNGIEQTHTVDDKKNERLEVFSIKARGQGASVWSKVGVAWINRDGSINVYLNSLPLDGKLHIRKSAQKLERN